MSNVIYCQNFFCPDDNQFNRLKLSLMSLIQYCNNVEPMNKYSFILTGWTNDNYKEEIDFLMTEIGSLTYFDRVLLRYNSKNYGKGIATNNAIKEFDIKCDYLFLYDCDIQFGPGKLDIVDILIKQQNEMNTIGKLEYPVISANFEEHQVHNLGSLDKEYKTKYGLVKCSTGRFGCIGGGCWLVKKTHWDEIGGYYTSAVYGFEDGKFYIDTLKMKKMVCLSMDICVIHPLDIDIMYNNFKADTNINRVQKMTYNELLKDSEKFWKNRNND